MSTRKIATPAERIAYAKVVASLGCVEVTKRCNGFAAQRHEAAKGTCILEAVKRVVGRPFNYHHKMTERKIGYAEGFDRCRVMVQEAIAIASVPFDAADAP